MISYVLIYDMFPYDICPPFEGMYSDYFFETLKQPADFWKTIPDAMRPVKALYVVGSSASESSENAWAICTM